MQISGIGTNGYNMGSAAYDSGKTEAEAKTFSKQLQSAQQSLQSAEKSSGTSAGTAAGQAALKDKKLREACQGFEAMFLNIMDRLSGSTAKVHFVIRTNVAEGGKIERDNMYYNLSDVGQIAVNELGQALNIICSNMERESDIFDIKVDVTVSSQRRTASLISAVPDKPQVKPGETVYLKTTIKPYRRSKEILTIPYTVPRGQRLGPVRLDVRGGGLIPVSQLILAQQAAAGIDVTAEEDKTVSTTAKLKDYLSADRNNEIVVTPSASPAPMRPAASAWRTISLAASLSRGWDRPRSTKLLLPLR